MKYLIIFGIGALISQNLQNKEDKQSCGDIFQETLLQMESQGQFQ
jgi:hypothetical protein